MNSLLTPGMGAAGPISLAVARSPFSAAKAAATAPVVSYVVDCSTLIANGKLHAHAADFGAVTGVGTSRQLSNSKRVD